ncbi:hypothetical protein A2U01_0048730, partial [Trifolium medium]|nr:hypothetical protein [Trifolium medium]
CSISARRAEGTARCARREHEEWNCFCQLRAAQEGWRVAPASGKESLELLSSARRAGEDGASRQSVTRMNRNALSRARRAASSGASRTFNVHHAHRAEQVARRASAKSI